MNEKLFYLHSQKKPTNHILHLLLTCCTFGVWAIVWYFVASGNRRHNANLSGQMGQILHYKEQGLSDSQTRQRMKMDALNAEVNQGRLMFFLIAVIVVFGFLLAK